MSLPEETDVSVGGQRGTESCIHKQPAQCVRQTNLGPRTTAMMCLRQRMGNLVCENAEVTVVSTFY